jgi:hypothetical protein
VCLRGDYYLLAGEILPFHPINIQTDRPCWTLEDSSGGFILEGSPYTGAKVIIFVDESCLNLDECAIFNIYDGGRGNRVVTVSSWTTMKSPMAETLRPLKGTVSEIVPNPNTDFTCAPFNRQAIFKKNAPLRGDETYFAGTS